MLQRGQELQSTEAQPRVSDHPAIKAKITVAEASAGLPGSLLHRISMFDLRNCFASTLMP